MSFYHHGSIRKYTAAILDFFNDIEVQYVKDSGTVLKPVPIAYSAREKSALLDNVTNEQLLSGNYNVLPRGSIILSSMIKNTERVTNKNIKINKFQSENSIEYTYNSVPYDFTYDLQFLCRGMNEASQIVEQIAVKFNPVVNIDIWEVSNLNEPTRVPLKLLDIAIETDEFDEYSTNLTTVSLSVTLTGNLYPPIKSQDKVKEFKIYLNEITSLENATRVEMMQWDTDLL